VTDEDYARWALDGQVLAQIGRALMAQSLEFQIRVPRELADAAVAAWQRDSAGPLGEETEEQRSARHRGAYLGLIGLSLEERGRPDGDDVVVKLDAWFIGEALNAADADGLLDGVYPPPMS
jgi:hypothetical protein